MTYTTTQSTAKTKYVKRLWSTNVAMACLPDTEIPPVSKNLSIGNAVLEHYPIETHVDYVPALRDLFLDAMQRLADSDRSQGLQVHPFEHVNLELQLWRAGFEIPAWIDPGPYIGWLFLAATPSKHSDSGSIAVLDPRAGSAMSAVPGLPWGNSLAIPPRRGNLAIVPGWLTSSVLPLEQHQTCVVVVATVGSPALEKEGRM